jgi:hypothetical protein
VQLTWRTVAYVLLALVGVWLLIGLTGSAGLSEWQQVLVVFAAIAAGLVLVVRRTGQPIARADAFLLLTAAALIFGATFVPSPYDQLLVLGALVWFYAGYTIRRRRASRR